jgi:hypothetical protein
MIVAEAADGHGAVFSLGEIDAKLGNRRMLVARRCDGRALAAQDGPLRLVVPAKYGRRDRYASCRPCRSCNCPDNLHIVCTVPINSRLIVWKIT